MKINTKVVFEWNPKSKQYEEVYCDSYEYNGEVAECQWPSWLGGDQNRHRGWWTPQQGRYGTIGEYGTPNATMYNPQRQFDQYSGMGNQDYMNKLRSFGSEGSMFGPTLQQPIRPDTSNLNSYGREGTASMLEDISMDNIPLRGPSQYTAVGGTTQEFAAGLPGPSGTWKGGDVAKGATDKASSFMGKYGGAMAVGGGALVGAATGFMQAGSQKKGLGVAIKELDPLKGKYLGEHERQLGLAEAYRPGGKYSRYMGGQIMSQAAESAGQESQRMVASGITSPSMMRAMARQSRSQAQNALPGMEMQLSQMALPYEQMGAQSLTQYGGVVEQLASLKGARSAINPWASALSGGMQGAMGAASMMSSFMSDRRMKKDIKYLHTSNDGHKVYSFKYKDGDTKYSGVMAQDVLKINPNAVTLKNGMFAVYYDMIDVDMQQLDII